MKKPSIETKQSKSRKVAKLVQPTLFEVADVIEQEVIHTLSTASKRKRVKKLEDYKRTRPAEIKLFGFLTPEEKKYSNTIELYDFMPKFFWGKVERENGKYLPTLKREFECRGIKYKIAIAPARIGDEDHYPGRREEIVEGALRKLTCDGRGEFLDDSASVVFSLNELQRELKKMGHSYSINEIKEALLVCTKASIEVHTEDGGEVLVSSIFESLGLRTWRDWKSKGQQTSCFVRFNPLVTSSIKNGTFRRLNYEKYMTYKFVIARQLYKRISHHYTQASIMNTYEIMLSTIIRDFGLTACGQLRDNLRKVEESLKEMMKNNDLTDVKTEKIIDEKGRLIDAKFILRPHVRFAGEMIGANETQRKIKAMLLPNKTSN